MPTRSAAPRAHRLSLFIALLVFAMASARLPAGEEKAPRRLERISPPEALPEGGQVVTLHGTGFSGQMQIFVGDRQAELVELVSPARCRIRVPAGAVGTAEVTAREGKDAFAGALPFGYAPHPFLLVSRQALPALRQKWHHPHLRPYRELIRKAADKAIEAGLDERKPGRGIAMLAWCHAFSSEETYLDAVLPRLDAVCEKPAYKDFKQMQVGSMAVAYDLLFEELGPERRGRLAAYLDGAVDWYLDAAANNRWFLTNISNTNPVGNSGGLLAALALRHTRPARAEAAVDYVRKNLTRYAEVCIAPDGGNVEGPFYHNYGFSYFLLAAEAMRHVLGDRTLLKHPHIERGPAFLRAVTSSRRDFFAYNDSFREVPANHILAHYGWRRDDALLRWLADEQAAAEKAYRGPFRVLSFLWRDTTAPNEAPPPVPVLQVLGRVQLATLRSEPAIDATLAVGVKGSAGPLSHHHQHDLGSFVLDHRGERILVDPGYRAGAAADHTVPVIDGQGPQFSGSFITNAWEDEEIRAVAIDSTEGYRPNRPRRVRRSLVLVGDHTLVVLDDIVPAEGAPGEVVSRFQPAGEAALSEDAASVTLSSGTASLRMQYLIPARPALATIERNERTALEARYTAEPDRPAVFVLHTTDAPPQARLDEESGTCTLTFADGRDIVFAKTPRGWGLRVTDDGEEKVLASPAPKQPLSRLDAPGAADPIILDGDLTEPAWQTAPESDPFVRNWTWEEPPVAQFPTTVRGRWDAEALYLAFTCFEPDLKGMITTAETVDDDPHNEDRIEIHIDPNPGRSERRYSVRVNAAGFVWPDLEDGTEARAAVGRLTSAEGPSAWTLEVRIPWPALGRGGPPVGEEIALGLIRIRAQAPREDSYWSRAYLYTFQAPWRWGRLTLTDRP